MSLKLKPVSAENRAHLLVVDDDERLRDRLGSYLVKNGYSVSLAEDATAARRHLSSLCYDLVILDVTMPGEDGLALARALRERNPDLPILLLTARKEIEHRIAGLESGADDYMGKPFEPRELLLRMAALLRRARNVELGWVRFGPFRYDLERRRLWRDGKRIFLTARQSEMLTVLAEAGGRPVRRELLVDGATGGIRSVDVQVNRLRQKIGEDATEARYLVSVRGEGYALRAERQ